MEIESKLAQFRQKRGFSAVQVAEMAGVTRQTIYAIEAGSYVPNTTVALRLARALEVTVEELFALPEETAGVRNSTRVEFLEGEQAYQAGQPVQLCRVDKRVMATQQASVPWYLPASDGVVGKASRVELFDGQENFGERLLLAGCDPAMSVVARHARAAGVELVLAHRNSSKALELLKRGQAHVAGVHLRGESGETNRDAIQRLFPGNTVALVSFAVWEQGLVVARGNPKEIRGVEGLARKDVTIVNREKGAGTRFLLDSLLKKAGMSAAAVRGYEHAAAGHLAAAWQVHSGAVDCAMATRVAARVFGLDFIPLVTESYDLAVRRRHLRLRLVQNLFEAMSRAAFRRELESFGGYDVRMAGVITNVR